jgi:SAM-dependent methyltransferase
LTISQPGRAIIDQGHCTRGSRKAAWYGEVLVKSMYSILKSVYHALPRPPSSHYRCREFGVNPYALLPLDATIFDIGSKEARGSYGFGPPPADARIVCVDMVAGPGVDLVADAHDMHMVSTDSVDCVVTVSTLEHVRDPSKVVAEIYRILKPGGFVYINVPFVFPFHADPDDFYRFSCNGIKLLCQQFERLDSGFNRGPASTMHHLLVHFLAMLCCFNSRALYGINIDVFSWLLFWVKYLDAFLSRYSMANVIHTGTYFIGRKPDAAESLADQP